MIDLNFEQKQAEAESIARNALGISWWGTESAARRVAEHAAEKTLKYERKIKAADRLARLVRHMPYNDALSVLENESLVDACNAYFATREETD